MLTVLSRSLGCNVIAVSRQKLKHFLHSLGLINLCPFVLVGIVPAVILGVDRSASPALRHSSSTVAS